METLEELRITPVSELMQKKVATIDGNRYVAEAIQVMKLSKAASVIVLPRNTADVFGILTVRDILGKVIDPGINIHRDIWNTQIYEIMTKPVYAIDPDMPVKYALRMMNRLGVRRLVLLRGKELQGIISENEIFQAVQGLLPVTGVAL